jgi:hypothetical protein
MSSNGYRVLGFAVWQGGKWYLRRRLPSPRRVLLAGLAAGLGATALAAIAKRAA